jgi:outer membrane biosynthesis protein TonB
VVWFGLVWFGLVAKEKKKKERKKKEREKEKKEKKKKKKKRKKKKRKKRKKEKKKKKKKEKTVNPIKTKKGHVRFNRRTENLGGKRIGQSTKNSKIRSTISLNIGNIGNISWPR